MSQSSSDDRVQYVPERTIQQLFNQSSVPAMIADGRLRPQVLDDRHLSQDGCLAIGETYCSTFSQYVRYWNSSGRWVVEVHRYVRGDGSIAASGREDPKRLRLSGRVYVKSNT